MNEVGLYAVMGFGMQGDEEIDQHRSKTTISQCGCVL